MTFDGDIIKATTDYAQPRSRRDYRPLERLCTDCGKQIQARSSRCRPCAQKMRRKIEGQVRRLLALADQRRAEEAQCPPV